MALVELGPSRAEDEDRQARRPVDEALDELEERVVGPVEVLEEEDERPSAGNRLDEALPGAKRLLAIRLAATHESHQWGEARLQPLGVVDSGEDLAELLGCSARPSDSRMPACAFTISPSAQNVMPSP